MKLLSWKKWRSVIRHTHAYNLLQDIWESLNKYHMLLFMKYTYTYNTHMLSLQLFSFVTSELWKLYYYKTHVTPTYRVIIHLGESSQTLCAVVYEVKVHIPIETVIIFLF